MKKALLFLARGFEETEAIATLDVLRRGGIDAKLVSIYDTLEVEGAHQIVIKADHKLSDVKEDLADAVILPGGMPGAENLQECKELGKLLTKHNDEGKLVCAICAAPMVLGHLEILKEGKNAACYPGFEDKLNGANYRDKEGAVRCDNVITGRGPAYAWDFGLCILKALIGDAQHDEVKKGLLHQEQ